MLIEELNSRHQRFYEADEVETFNGGGQQLGSGRCSALVAVRNGKQYRWRSCRQATAGLRQDQTVCLVHFSSNEVTFPR